MVLSHFNVGLRRTIVGHRVTIRTVRRRGAPGGHGVRPLPGSWAVWELLIDVGTDRYHDRRVAGRGGRPGCRPDPALPAVEVGEAVVCRLPWDGQTLCGSSIRRTNRMSS